MNVNLPKDTFKSMPKRAWIYISLGIMIFLILIGMTLYKYGGIYIKNEKTLIDKSNNKIEKIVKEIE
jgi:hypothetical protein